MNSPANGLAFANWETNLSNLKTQQNSDNSTSGEKYFRISLDVVLYSAMRWLLSYSFPDKLPIFNSPQKPKCSMETYHKSRGPTGSMRSTWGYRVSMINMIEWNGSKTNQNTGFKLSKCCEISMFRTENCSSQSSLYQLDSSGVPSSPDKVMEKQTLLDIRS